MEFSLQVQEITVLFAFLLAIIFVCATIDKARRNKRTGRKPPEAAGAWPIIGHLRLFRSNQLLHQMLGEMADKYGKVFMIRLGNQQILVISSLEVTKECFTTNDKVFINRPKSLAIKIMGYDHIMPGFAPYGQYWRDVRKLATVELLSPSRLELLKHVRDTETNSFTRELYVQCVKNGGHVAVQMTEKFWELTMNIIVRTVAGKRYVGAGTETDEESRRCQKTMADFFHLLGLFLVSDTVPILGWLDTVNGYVGKMKKTARELDYMLGNWVEEHKRRRLGNEIGDKEQDFIHVMLSAFDEGKISAQDANTVVKATCLSLILGGSDTTVITLTWAISLLLNNRHVLKKAQDELDFHVGMHRQVDESDIKNLIYIQAIVKETLRLYPPLPLSAPREAVEDCSIAGFHIPAGTRLFVNLRKLHLDPTVWKNPSEFRPERFLDDHVNLDVKGLDFEYLPFGSGRRKCPGISFALQVLHLTLARLLHSFEITTVLETAVDMSEGPGLTAPKATPLEVILTPRLSSTSLSSGGSDTTVITVIWALTLLLNNHHVLKKAQDELNLHVGMHGQVDELDIKNLSYIQAIDKETLRLHPSLPLSAPREAVKDCTIDGFHIPAGTRLFVNLWKLHHDPSVWENPSEFRPERFLDDHVNLDVKGLDFEYLPFGSGRRKCPGILFALQVLHLTLARLLHSFEITTETEVDMSERPGLTGPKATPLEVILTPRLLSTVFEF